jgi:hypothetical protein
MKEYKIEVLCSPDYQQRTTPYFLCILQWDGNQWSNSGKCGWASTIGKAWDQAYGCYNFMKETEACI